jgi:hypothetical protein
LGWLFTDSGTAFTLSGKMSKAYRIDKKTKRQKNKRVEGVVWIEIICYTWKASRKKFICLFKNHRNIVSDSVA